jgi:hypothetical protein
MVSSPADNTGQVAFLKPCTNFRCTTDTDGNNFIGMFILAPFKYKSHLKMLRCKAGLGKVSKQRTFSTIY